jgi:hypothetical protein
VAELEAVLNDPAIKAEVWPTGGASMKWFNLSAAVFGFTAAGLWFMSASDLPSIR